MEELTSIEEVEDVEDLTSNKEVKEVNKEVIKEVIKEVNKEVNKEVKEVKEVNKEVKEVKEEVNKEVKEVNNSNVINIYSNALENNPIIEICDLDNIIVNNEPIEIKTHDTIYLEIYKKAKQKAKEIRKNAIEAFLEAKNIKVKYNLNTLDGSSSDEESKF